MSTTALMSLELPTVGPQGTEGPDYAEMINAAFEIIDAHDHTEDSGARITPAALNLNDDVDFQENNIDDLRSLRLHSQASPIAEAADINSVYVSGGNLYYNNSSGTAIKITDGSGINLSSIGSIGGDFSTSDASVTYSDTSKSFLFKQDSTVTADIAVGSVFIYENIDSAKYIKVKSPTSLASDLTITLPSSMPASTRALSMTSAGVIAAGTSSIIVTDDIASNAITTAKIADSNITTAKINALAVTRAKLEAVGNQTSSSCGNFSTSSTSFVDITNLTISITTSGRPVIVFCQDDGSGHGTFGGFIGTSTSLTFKLLRNAATIVEFGTASGTSKPPSAMFAIDAPAAGTYTYKVQLKAGSAAGVNAYFMKLMAYEL
jgi:hypothetical protein